jgi:hypothetical protein
MQQPTPENKLEKVYKSKIGRKCDRKKKIRASQKNFKIIRHFIRHFEFLEKKWFVPMLKKSCILFRKIAKKVI